MAGLVIAVNLQAHSTALPRSAPARVLACGAFLKNRACLLDGTQVHWSAMHGDLGEADACAALATSLDAILGQASGPIQAVAHDLHPDFYSTHLAQALAHRLGVPAIGVQHHHAHVGVVLAEQDVCGPVIGVALDGMGLGADGAAWGGELLWLQGSQHAHRWRRVGHLAPLAQPGGDAAAREPWRLAAAVLFATGRGSTIVPRFAAAVGAPSAGMVHTLLQRQLHCAGSSSAGRWFDAAAGALGLSVRQTEEAQAAIALEQQARTWLSTHPDFDYPYTSLDLHPVVAELLDLPGDDPLACPRGAAQFHLALAAGLATHACHAAHRANARHVVLAGGCFANGVLRQSLRQRLQQAGMVVLEPGTTGCGDAGLALGQAWVAAAAMPQHADAVVAPLEELEN